MLSTTETASTSEADCRTVAGHLRDDGLQQIPGESERVHRFFRVSPRPFGLPADLVSFLQNLGPALLKFYRAANKLYLRGQYSWVREYLDLGKPESLIEHGRMNYQKNRVPAVIRPDILLTPEGYLITELDSVPGGIGLTAGMSREYAILGHDVLGGPDGMIDGFASAMGAWTDDQEPAVAIVVSDESESYRSEMEWLARALRDKGKTIRTIRPEEVEFAEGGLFMEVDGEPVKIDVLYRFFELFDLKNIPKAELIAYAVKKRWVVVTPPYKHYLEEKMLLALFHFPLLESYWLAELGEEHFSLLRRAIPQTWIFDPRPVPPHAVIPDFRFRGEPINDWRSIREATQKDRRLVIKPSGFSPLAWGGHGVVVGHDVSAERWSIALETALEGFPVLPYVLQRYHEGTRFPVEYYDAGEDRIKQMQGRVRLSPYYFVSGDDVNISGALATICPLDKKLIHGMVDAVMVPSASMLEGTGDA